MLMLCYFSTAQGPRATLPQKAGSPLHPHPTWFLGALVLYWLKQSLRAHPTCKKLWIPLGVRHGTKLPRTCLESQCQATSVSASGQLPRLWLMWRELSGPAWVQKNSTQHMQTSAVSEGTQTRKICQVPRASSNSDVSRSAEYRRPWGGGIEWPRLGWIWGTPAVRTCLCVCVAYLKLCIQP